MRQLLNVFFFLFLCVFAKAQSGSISGKITDTSLKKVMPLATVTVFKAADTTIVTYRLSNDKGEFKIPNLPFDVPLRFMVSFSGYEAFRKDFTLSVTKSTILFDSVILKPTFKQLDEVMVISERPPVVIKKDTIEFNASAFKTLPNAIVEDLLKKLPGVQVDADGNITVNGKVVNRILVDGKTFFGEDPKMASKNLPANIIDKVQVVDDKEQQLRNGDDNMNNVGKVVNITLKKGVKKGWFGKVYAGGGTEKVFEGGGIANIFRDTLQLSVLGYANNLNRPGFGYSDLSQAGGFQRNSSLTGSSSTSTSNSSSGSSSITINGVNFGGSRNGGVATSKGVGFNLNHAPNAKNSFFAQYFYGNVLTDRQRISEVGQYYSDTIIKNNTNLNSNSIGNSHNIGIGAKLKPDSVTTILATVNYSIGLLSENKNSLINSNNNLLGNLSNGNIYQVNQSNTYNFKENISYTKLSKTKAGRRFSFLQNLSINNRFNNYITNSTTHYIYPTTYDSLLQQLRDEALPQLSNITSISYSEPFNKLLILRLGSRYDYSKLTNDIATFNANTTTEKYDVVNSSQTSNFWRESHKLYVSTGLEFKILKDLSITPSVRFLSQHVNNYLHTSPKIEQQQNNILPSVNIVYKQLSFSYNKDIVLPSYTYLIPISDNTNPYYITKGNAGLTPSTNENFNINYYFNNSKKLLNINLNGGGYFAKNDVIQSTVVDNQGIQTVTPVNADGTSSFWLNYNINKQYKKGSNFSFSWNTGAYYSLDKSRLLYNGSNSSQTTFQINQWAGFGLNFNDKFEWNCNGNLGSNFTNYSNESFKKLTSTTYSLYNEIIVRYPKHVIWETSLAYDYNGNVPAGYLKDSYLCNFAINFTMLKNERGILKITAFDLLKSNSYVSYYASRNTITSSQSNILPRYFMATFTYNIQTIGGAKKKVGGERLFLF